MAKRKTPTVDVEKFKTDLLAAKEVAMKAVRGADDGGTCCMDYPVVDVPLTAEVREVCELLGFRPDAAYGIYKGWTGLWGFPGSHAQGTPRTTGAEAVAKELAARGWKTSVYYAMD